MRRPPRPTAIFWGAVDNNTVWTSSFPSSSSASYWKSKRRDLGLRRSLGCRTSGAQGVSPHHSKKINWSQVKKNGSGLTYRPTPIHFPEDRRVGQDTF